MEIYRIGVKIIDVKKAKIAFKDFLEEYDNKEHVSFKLKVVHII